jgi:hypothetical protein
MLSLDVWGNLLQLQWETNTDAMIIEGVIKHEYEPNKI